MSTKASSTTDGKPKARRAKKTSNAAKVESTVLILRTCDKDMRSHGGFIWPLSGPVEAPDWEPTSECGHGLHGWKWGHGDWGNKIKGDDIKWLVVEVVESSIVNLDGKVKFPRGIVIAVYSHWREAMAHIWAKRPVDPETTDVATGYSGHASATGYSGHASATGNYGHASATGNYGHASATGYSGHASATGYSGHASATGYYGHASATGYSGHASATGNYGHASATGDSGHASATGNYGHASATGNYGHASATGNYGHASATGYSGHASATGYYGHASATGYYGWGIAGYCGTAKASEGGVITILWSPGVGKRPRAVTGYPGEDGIVADVFYRVEDGHLVRVD